jgi:hypothetical protein
MAKLGAWLQPMLTSIGANAKTLSTPEGNVYELPNGLDRLRKGIMHYQQELARAHEQSNAYEEAWKAAQMEMQAAVEQNAVWQRDINTKLYALKSEWIKATEALGIDAQIRRDLPVPAPEEKTA